MDISLRLFISILLGLLSEKPSVEFIILEYDPYCYSEKRNQSPVTKTI
jgi:hypothetical protein